MPARGHGHAGGGIADGIQGVPGAEFELWERVAKHGNIKAEQEKT